ncbi:Rossmann-like domain-containing protein [Sinomicrobium oceani]|uniref:Rossmann-like domain-containing protein n=1 Tax=Sinomicrobium oceani TaxID=1150368 RepID=A0A1K1QNA4_9FLAO|nr:Rossmann-like and DUF2520 domain-containing protein [Sinomicrobium oceani]SFW61137.1 Rossmann-like domain-containing protein [Sinomicrobium oceani]
MITVVIIGSGNVATHLCTAFRNSTGVRVIQTFNRKNKAIGTIPVTDDYALLRLADLYIIAVSDDAIAEVSQQLPFTGRLVVHTSGSVALEELHSGNRKGVFYPLQSFSMNKTVNFADIPLCIEAADESDTVFLKTVAGSISDHVHPVDSDQRRSLHLSAVFVNNFTNYMYTIGHELCKENRLPFDLLRPLIRETAAKIEDVSPEEAQTGPARRHDESTIRKHLDLLKPHPGYEEIYRLLSKNIREMYPEQE